jgi:hypothetical protein
MRARACKPGMLLLITFVSTAFLYALCMIVYMSYVLLYVGTPFSRCTQQCVLDMGSQGAPSERTLSPPAALGWNRCVKHPAWVALRAGYAFVLIYTGKAPFAFNSERAIALLRVSSLPTEDIGPQRGAWCWLSCRRVAIKSFMPR